MTARPSAVDSVLAQGTTDSSFSSGVGNDLQQRCHTIESGLNDLRNVLKTLTTTCAILERSAEKLGSDMMEIRGILARKDSLKTAKDILVRQPLGSGGAVGRVNDVSASSKLVSYTNLMSIQGRVVNQRITSRYFNRTLQSLDFLLSQSITLTQWRVPVALETRNRPLPMLHNLRLTSHLWVACRCLRWDLPLKLHVLPPPRLPSRIHLRVQ